MKKLIYIVVVFLAIFTLYKIGASLTNGDHRVAQEIFCNGKFSIISEYRVTGGEFLSGRRDYMVSINETEWSKKTLYKFFKQTFRDFLPLPVNTNVLVKTIELPDKNKEIHSYDPALVNIFIDPKEFSKEEFEEFSRCVKDNIEMLNNFVSKTPNFTGSRFGGLAYITGSALLSMIHTMSADGKLVNGFETDFMGTVWEEGVYGGDVFNGGVNWLRQKAPQRGDNSLNPFSQ